jgi:hypothetical protein
VVAWFRVVPVMVPSTRSGSSTSGRVYSRGRSRAVRGEFLEGSGNFHSHDFLLRYSVVVRCTKGRSKIGEPFINCSLVSFFFGCGELFVVSYCECWGNFVVTMYRLSNLVGLFSQLMNRLKGLRGTRRLLPLPLDDVGTLVKGWLRVVWCLSYLSTAGLKQGML